MFSAVGCHGCAFAHVFLGVVAHEYFDDIACGPFDPGNFGGEKICDVSSFSDWFSDEFSAEVVHD